MEWYRSLDSAGARAASEAKWWQGFLKDQCDGAGGWTRNWPIHAKHPELNHLYLPLSIYLSWLHSYFVFHHDWGPTIDQDFLRGLAPSTQVCSPPQCSNAFRDRKAKSLLHRTLLPERPEARGLGGLFWAFLLQWRLPGWRRQWWCHCCPVGFDDCHLGEHLPAGQVSYLVPFGEDVKAGSADAWLVQGRGMD